MREKDILPMPHGLQFTRNWFRSRNLSTFCQFVYPHWSGRDITYLELGVFEAQSTVWMLQHVLTSEASRVVCVDPWLMTRKMSSQRMLGVMERAYHNLQPWTKTGCIGTAHKRCQIVRANSAEILRKMCGRDGFAGIKKNSIDLCMVDGNHNALAVLDDLRHVYRLVKVGGEILMDDIENDIEKLDHVKQGLRMFLDEIGNKMILKWKHRYCECYTKIK